MNKLLKSRKQAIVAIVLAIVLAISAIPATHVSAANSGKTDKTASQVVSDMTVGWNIGNTLDAFGSKGSFPYTTSLETYWGNPKVTRELIEAVGKAGFNTIRIPVSWGQYTTGSNYEIPDWWMKRVKEVVDICIENDMYVILNSHHDINEQFNFYYPKKSEQARSEKYLSCIWTQIATEFKDYDSHLVFETMNEPRLAGDSEEWWFPRSNPSSNIREAVACINSYNQVALDAIRATGGNNATRCVMVPGYDASCDGAMVDGFKMPTDSASNRLILSIHAYVPYYFALASDGYVTRFEGNSGDIDNLFNDLNRKYLSQGIPVVVGETSATNRNNSAEREKWADYFWGSASKYSNVAMVLWDNNIYDNANGSDGECHRYIDRNNYRWMDQNVIDAIMKHVDGTPCKSAGGSSPVNPRPVDPTPVDPTPVDPTPVDPRPVDPTPVAPRPVDPTPVDPTPVDPTPVDPTPVDPTPVEPSTKGLTVSYTINNWGSGYQVLIKIKNEGPKVDTWTLRVNKNDVKIDTSWNVNIVEDGNYYVITPMTWNSAIETGNTVEFGIQGNGTGVKNFIECSVK